MKTDFLIFHRKLLIFPASKKKKIIKQYSKYRTKDEFILFFDRFITYSVYLVSGSIFKKIDFDIGSPGRKNDLFGPGEVILKEKPGLKVYCSRYYRVEQFILFSPFGFSKDSRYPALQITVNP